MSSFDIRRLNLNLLPALEALLAERNVSRAAARVHVSQSAMSHSLAKLREALEDPLLVPVGRTLALTPRAEQIGASLARALDGLGAAVAPPEPFAPATSTRTFRIATLDFFELTALPRLLRELRQRAPHVRLEIERFAPSHLTALAAGDLDLALIGDAIRSSSPAIRTATLGALPFRVLARPDHPSIGRRLTLATFVELGHILVSVEGRRDGVVDRALARRGLERRVALRLPHFATAPLAVRESDWICTIAEPIAELAVELHGLRSYAPPLELPDTSVVALWPTRHDEEPASRWLRERILAATTPRRRREHG